MNFRQWKRREIITLFGGAVIASLLAERPQQPERPRRIGVLMAQAADDLDGQARVTAFLQGLRELGWIEGRNVQLDYRWGGGDVARIRRDAAELVALTPDVILAGGGQVVGPLQEATRTVPIVFTQTADPVGAGFVASLARPGGNATGFTNFEYGLSGKWLEVLREVVPRWIKSRPHCLVERVRDLAPRTDHRACGTTPVARCLSVPLLRDRWRLDLLRA